MRGKLLILAALTLWISALSTQARAHCQIPCGIYDDETRFTLMLEDVQTIEKAMAQIKEISSSKSPDWNQLVRWVTNKDEHAAKLSEIVSFYFMAQRVKPVAPEDKAGYQKYVTEITLLHRMMVAAMKTKQTVDPAYCKELRDLIEKFRSSYLGAAAEKHGHSG